MKTDLARTGVDLQLPPGIERDDGEGVSARLAPENAAQWRGEVKRIGDLTEGEIAFWQRLAATRPELRSPYFSFEFARAVADAGARARVCLLYEDGIPAGFFPFQFSCGATQAMAAGERIGGALNDFCGALLDRSRHGAIGVERLLRCARLSSFEFSHLEETQTALGLQGLRSDAARVRLDGGIEQYWANVKSHHDSGYNTLRRRERRIEREFRSVDFTFSHDNIDDLLTLLVTEKRRQFERTGAAGDALAEGWVLRCIERIALYREGRCVPVLSSLYLDGCWAALHFGIRANGVLHCVFPLYNEKFSKLSPGLVLLARIINAAPSHGIDEFDLAEGSSQYKRLLATESYSLYRGVWHRSNPRGLLYRGYLSLCWRVRGMRKVAVENG